MNLGSTLGESQPDDLIHSIFNEHHEALLLFAKRQCNQFNFDSSIANDLLQELYIKIILRPDLIRKGMAQKGVVYLFTSLKRMCIDITRKNKGWDRVNVLFDPEAPEIADVTHLATTIHTEQFLEQMQRWLSEQAYEVMRLYVEGYKYHEIAEKLGITTSNVNVIIHRARKVIAKELKRLDEEFSQ
ncbi:MAG: RNA polymerase sigma factor [Saprospiraceae bacterium]|nr:RNA polymerase sigma factor [Saprospiraceae bacterium]